MATHIVLWVYIVLLVIGGLFGYLKGKSPVSLIMSVVFAAALALCATSVVAQPLAPELLLGALALVFIMRLAKTRKFMPAGLMLALTAAALALMFI